MILPHTDLEGAYAIGERLRRSLKALEIPLIGSRASLRMTASIGVAASAGGEETALIASADDALYVAKRRGKNRTVRGTAPAADVVGAE